MADSYGWLQGMLRSHQGNLQTIAHLQSQILLLENAKAELTKSNESLSAVNCYLVRELAATANNAGSPNEGIGLRVKLARAEDKIAQLQNALLTLHTKYSTLKDRVRVTQSTLFSCCSDWRESVVSGNGASIKAEENQDLLDCESQYNTPENHVSAAQRATQVGFIERACPAPLPKHIHRFKSASQDQCSQHIQDIQASEQVKADSNHDIWLQKFSDLPSYPHQPKFTNVPGGKRMPGAITTTHPYDATPLMPPGTTRTTSHDTSYQRHEEDFQAVRRVLITNLPPKTTLADVATIVRCGLVVSIVVKGLTVVVEFIEERAARAYAHFALDYPIRIGQQMISLQLDTNPTPPMSRGTFMAAKFQGHTRCLRVCNIDPYVLKQEILPKALGGTSDEMSFNVIDVVQALDGTVHLAFDGIVSAGSAFSRLTTYRKFKNCQVFFDPDPCAQPARSLIPTNFTRQTSLQRMKWDVNQERYREAPVKSSSVPNASAHIVIPPVKARLNPVAVPFFGVDLSKFQPEAKGGHTKALHGRLTLISGVAPKLAKAVDELNVSTSSKVPVNDLPSGCDKKSTPPEQDKPSLTLRSVDSDDSKTEPAHQISNHEITSKSARSPNTPPSNSDIQYTGLDKFNFDTSSWATVLANKPCTLHYGPSQPASPPQTSCPAPPNSPETPHRATLNYLPITPESLTTPTGIAPFLPRPYGYRNYRDIDSPEVLSPRPIPIPRGGGVGQRDPRAILSYADLLEYGEDALRGERGGVDHGELEEGEVLDIGDLY